MMTYLQGGWYDAARSLRTEVMDGAADAAGMLLRSDVEPRWLVRLALRVRGLFSIFTRSRGHLEAFSDADRAAMVDGLSPYADDSPALFSFLSDCIEQVETPADLMAFYIHLIHVHHMLRLLQRAMSGPALSDQQRPAAAPQRRTTKKAPQKPSARSAKKSTTRTKSASKKTAKKTTKRPQKQSTARTGKSATKKAAAKATRKPAKATKKAAAKTSRKPAKATKKAAGKATRKPAKATKKAAGKTSRKPATAGKKTTGKSPAARKASRSSTPRRRTKRS